MKLTEAIDEQVSQLERLRGIAEAIEAQKPTLICVLNRWASQIAVQVNSNAELQAAWAMLRKAFGRWKDKIVDTWCPYGSTAVTGYANEDIPQVVLRYTFDVNRPPEGMFSPDCRFVETTETTRGLVCEKAEAPHE